MSASPWRPPSAQCTWTPPSDAPTRSRIHSPCGAVRFAAVRLRRLDEIVDAAVAAHARNVRALAYRGRNAESSSQSAPSLARSRTGCRSNTSACTPHPAGPSVAPALRGPQSSESRSSFHPKPRVSEHSHPALRTLPGSPQPRRRRKSLHPGPEAITQRAQFFRRILQPSHFARQVRLRAQHHRAVNARIDHRRAAPELDRS